MEWAEELACTKFRGMRFDSRVFKANKCLKWIGQQSTSWRKPRTPSLRWEGPGAPARVREQEQARECGQRWCADAGNSHLQVLWGLVL